MKQLNTSDFLKYEPEQPAKASMIFIHGLGASGHDFQDFPQFLQNPHFPIRFIFPHAPQQPVTLNGGMVMPSWYDIYSLDRNEKTDFEGIKRSQKRINSLIQQELDSGIDAHNIIVGGFSQGGLIALYTALFYPLKLGGVLALSTYFPQPETLPKSDGLQTPVLMIHGMQDMVIQHELAHESFQLLKSFSVNISWNEYPMEHQICLEELQEVKQWINSCFTSS